MKGSAIKFAIRYILLAICLAFSLVIAAKGFSFFSPDFTQGFLRGREAYYHGWYSWGLYAHVIAAPPVLVIGAYLTLINKGRNKKLHRILGYFYTILLVGIAAPGGLLMSLKTITGWPSGLSFILLSIIWIVSTLKAVQSAKSGEIGRHQAYMQLSFLMTLAALILRLILPIGHALFPESPAGVYNVVSWLCWVPQLLAWGYYNRGLVLTNFKLKVATA